MRVCIYVYVLLGIEFTSFSIQLWINPAWDLLVLVWSFRLLLCSLQLKNRIILQTQLASNRMSRMYEVLNDYSANHQGINRTAIEHAWSFESWPSSWKENQWISDAFPDSGISWSPLDMLLSPRPSAPPVLFATWLISLAFQINNSSATSWSVLMNRLQRSFSVWCSKRRAYPQCLTRTLLYLIFNMQRL